MRFAPTASALPRAECIQLNAGHIPEAFALSCAAGWNQTHDDWLSLLELSDACFGIEIGGTLVATTTLVCFGLERTGRGSRQQTKEELGGLGRDARVRCARVPEESGWVGMVLTHPDFRLRGYARALVSHVIDHAKTLGVRTLQLDATDEGRPLYESFGFRPVQKVERWERRHSGEPSPASARQASGRIGRALAQSLDETSSLFELDAQACGCSRRHLLMKFLAAGDAIVEQGAYALCRPGRINRYLGPCIATSAAAAQSVIGEMLARHPEAGWFWDLLPANESAANMARQLGFERVRRLTRMAWGHEIQSRVDQIFAIAGFELG